MASISAETSPNDTVSTDILVLPNVFYPVIDHLAQSGHEELSSDLRTTLFQLEEVHPGFSRSFLQSFLAHQAIPSLDPHILINELILQLEKFCEKRAYLLSSSLSEGEFHELNKRIKQLKNALSRIPDDIDERRDFLELIKEIASAIKKTLDSLASSLQYFRTVDSRQALENEKKEFIRSSKNFSNTLKAFFRENQREDVYIAANNLLLQTDYLLRTMKIHSEGNALDPCLYPLFSQHEEQLKLSSSARYLPTNPNLRTSANARADLNYS